MSDMLANYREQLDLHSIIGQIDRDHAETRKLEGETEKFVAEQHDLIADVAKQNRDQWLGPWEFVASLSRRVAVAVISHFWRE